MPKKPRPRPQVAALPYEGGSTDELRFLLVTSRETGRWVLPKGWPMKRRRPSRAAEIEAYEEAGIQGRARKKPIGKYRYMKDGKILCEVSVFPLAVRNLLDEWPEQNERRRKWLSVKEAADLVDESDLKTLLSASPKLLAKS